MGARRSGEVVIAGRTEHGDDGSSQLAPTLLADDLVGELHPRLYPLTLGTGKRLLPGGIHSRFALTSATYPGGVTGLHYARQRG